MCWGFLVVKDWLAHFGSPGWDPKFPPKKRYRIYTRGVSPLVITEDVLYVL